MRRSFTDQIASSLGMVCLSGGMVMFPQHAGFPEGLLAASSVWWLAASGFIGYSLPRLVRQRQTRE